MFEIKTTTKIVFLSSEGKLAYHLLWWNVLLFCRVITYTADEKLC